MHCRGRYSLNARKPLPDMRQPTWAGLKSVYNHASEYNLLCARSHFQQLVPPCALQLHRWSFRSPRWYGCTWP